MWDWFHQIFAGTQTRVDFIIADAKRVSDRFDTFQQQATVKADSLVVKSSMLTDQHAAMVARLDAAHASTQAKIGSSVVDLHTQAAIAATAKAALAPVIALAPAKA
jgi:hypothetical protein